MLSFAKNALANYCGRFYILLIGIAILPFYMKYLGAAAFGLVGLYTVMQAWLSMLDMGLISTLSREVAYYHRQKNGLGELKKLLRSLEIIFLIINMIIILSMIFSASWIAHHWLNIENLSYSQVIHCIILMSGMISLRWFADLYRSGLLGMEYAVWLNSVSVFIVTLQYGGGYFLLRYITQLPTHFFAYQLMIVAMEPIILGLKLYKLIPYSLGYFNFSISWRLLEKIFPFSISIFYTSIIWIALTQFDKLILSHILPLSIYGYFSLVTIVSAGILQFSAPFSQVLLPRMTHLFSEKKIDAMLKLYKQATQLIAVIIFPLTGMIALFGTEIIYIWTGNQAAALWAGPVLRWYALGNGLLCISAFQYYLQFVYGNLKWHVLFNTFFVIIALPLIILSAYKFGALGTALTWFFLQTAAFLIWPRIIHNQFAPKLHRDWFYKDILPILIINIIVFCLIKWILIYFEWHSVQLLVLCSLSIIIFMISFFSSSTCRQWLVATL